MPGLLGKKFNAPVGMSSPNWCQQARGWDLADEDNSSANGPILRCWYGYPYWPGLLGVQTVLIYCRYCHSVRRLLGSERHDEQ